MRFSWKSTRSFDMEFLVSYILRIGLFVSLGFLARGLAWHWWNTGQLRFNYDLPQTNVFQFVTESIQKAVEGRFRPRLLNNLGMAVLMLTPYVRVFASVLYFAFAQHNWKYTLFTGFVLGTLTYSLFLR